jgi:hypothetical protein
MSVETTLNICALHPDSIRFSHILLELLTVPHTIRPHILVSTHSCRLLTPKLYFTKRRSSLQCDGVSYVIVLFFITNPQHTVSVYNIYVSRISMVGSGSLYLGHFH